MAIINVDIKNKSGIEDGSKKHPYNKIQRGIDVAKSENGKVNVQRIIDSVK